MKLCGIKKCWAVTCCALLSTGSLYAEEIPQNIRQNYAQASHQASLVSGSMAAEIALQKNQPAVAWDIYKMLLANNVDNASILARTTELAQDLGQVADAEQILAQWHKVEPNASFAQKVAQWRQNVIVGRANQAMVGLPALLKEAPNDIYRRQLFWYSTRWINRPDENMGDYYKIIHREAERYDTLVEGYIADVVFSAASNHPKSAVKALEKLSKKPFSDRVRTTNQYLIEHYPDILEAFFDQNDSQKMTQEWQEVHISFLTNQQKTDQAYALIQKLLTDDEVSDQTYLMAGVLALMQKEVQQSGVFFHQAYQKTAPAKRDAFAVLTSRLYLEHNQPVHAQEWLDKVGDQNANDKRLLQNRIDIAQNHWTRAKKGIITLRSAKNISLNEYALALAHYLDDGLKRLSVETLKKDCDDFLKLEQKQPSAEPAIMRMLHGVRATAYERLGDYRQAVNDLKIVNQLDPDNAEWLNNWGYTMLNLPQMRAQALEILIKANQLTPHKAHIEDSLGWAYFLNGNLPAASQYLQQAYQSTHDAEVGAHWGEVLWALDKRDQARQVWHESWKKNQFNRVLNDTLLRFQISFEQE